MFKIAIKILYIFYILLNKPMDLTKKKNLIRQKKNHFDIISSTFPFKVQMTYGDNDIPAHYVYSNSGRECAMIFSFGKTGCLRDTRLWGQRTQIGVNVSLKFTFKWYRVLKFIYISSVEVVSCGIFFSS